MWPTWPTWLEAQWLAPKLIVVCGSECWFSQSMSIRGKTQSCILGLLWGNPKRLSFKRKRSYKCKWEPHHKKRSHNRFHNNISVWHSLNIMHIAQHSIAHPKFTKGYPTWPFFARQICHLWLNLVLSAHIWTSQIWSIGNPWKDHTKCSSDALKLCR